MVEPIVKHIIQALENLGGHATKKEIHAELERIRTSSRIYYHPAAITKTLLEFRDKLFQQEDIGVWSLSKSNIYQEFGLSRASKENKMLFSLQNDSILRSLHFLSLKMDSIRKNRLNSTPGTHSWVNYICDLMFQFGFKIKKITKDFYLLFVDESSENPLVIMSVINSKQKDRLPNLDLSVETVLFYAAKYHKVNWGLITNGFSLVIIDCAGDEPIQKIHFDTCDQPVLDSDIQFYFEVYKGFSETLFALESNKEENGECDTSQIRDSNSGEFDLDYHYERANHDTVELFESLRSRILALSEGIHEKINKLYVAYSKKNNFCEIHFQRSQLKIWVNLRLYEIRGSKYLCRDVSNIGHYGTGDTEISLTRKEDVDHVIKIVKQS